MCELCQCLSPVSVSVLDKDELAGEDAFPLLAGADIEGYTQIARLCHLLKTCGTLHSKLTT